MAGFGDLGVEVADLRIVTVVEEAGAGFQFQNLAYFGIEFFKRPDARGEECQWRLLEQRLYYQTADDGSQRQIDELLLSVDGQEESYYFDITVGMQALFVGNR